MGIGCVWFHIHNIYVISALGLCRTLHVDLSEECLTYMTIQSVREYLSPTFLLLFLCEHYWQRFVPNTGYFKYLVNKTKTGVDRTSEASYKSEVSNGYEYNESKLFILYYIMLHYIVRNPTWSCMRRLVQHLYINYSRNFMLIFVHPIKNSHVLRNLKFQHSVHKRVSGPYAKPDESSCMLLWPE